MDGGVGGGGGLRSNPINYNEFNETSESNNNNKGNMYYKHFVNIQSAGLKSEGDGDDDGDCDRSGSGSDGSEIFSFVNSREILRRLTKENAIKFENPPTSIPKSHSYIGSMQPLKKSATILQETLNGRLATSLTADSISEIGMEKNFTMGRRASSIFSGYTADEHAMVPNALISDNASFNDQEEEEEASLLLPDVMTNSNKRCNGSKRIHMKSKSLSLSSASSSASVSGITTSTRLSICYRFHAYITRNWYLNYLIPISILIAFMLVAYFTRDYAKRLLFWIEAQNPWVIFAIFLLLFVIVSFPIVVGYFVLMITSGYLFGFFKGLATVILGANIGIAFAHITIRSLRHRIPLHRIIKNETGRAILRVISGSRAFRVVLFTRLTPIPFGLQNAIFGVSSINPRTYHSATFIGLLPAQVINIYLGSTLRSMHEVLNSHGTAVTGYISFGIEVICGVGLMFWVVQKARKELSETLLSCNDEEEIEAIDVQV